MLRRALPTVLAVVAILALGLAFLGEGSAQTRSAGAGQQVEVVNFPENQDVTVRGTPSQARLAGFEDQLISPNGSRDPTTWRQIGTLATDGFGWVVLSLGGNVQGPVTEPGAVIAVLVPEQAPILRALKDDQIVLFPSRPPPPCPRAASTSPPSNSASRSPSRATRSTSTTPARAPSRRASGRTWGTERCFGYPR
jgi:hypothetical protein